MNPVYIRIVKQLSQAELFFAQRSLELLHRDTIDSYRLRLNNPRTILTELSRVLMLIKQGSLKNEYGHLLCREALALMKDENTLIFKSVSKNFVLDRLSNSKKDFIDIHHTCQILIFENKNYAQNLANAVFDEIISLNLLGNLSPENLELLDKLIEYFLIELQARGFAKDYLHQFFRANFAPKDKRADFKEVYDILRTLIDKDYETFEILFHIGMPTTHSNSITISGLKLQGEEDIEVITAKTNEKFEEFRHLEDLSIYKMTVKSLDFLSAGAIAKRKLQANLDIMFMGYLSETIKIGNACFVVGQNSPTKANQQYLDFKLDGTFISNSEAYKIFYDKMSNLIDSKIINSNSLEKITSALRYLRLGSQSEALESRLLNFWIAIEYLFSSDDASKSKTERLNKYFPKIHSIAYAKKLFAYCHKMINQTISQHFPTYHQKNYIYLMNDSTTVLLSSLMDKNPLLCYRIKGLKKKFEDNKKIIEEINRHSSNLTQNLIRIYRTRNEIVHNGSKDIPILELTSHLRYYLVFIINGIVEFFINTPIDADQVGKISIDDYFNVADITHQSMIMEKTLTVTELLEFEYPIDYLH